MENKTKIVLNRKQEWINRLRTYRVLIDGKEVGSVRNGSAEEFMVTPGTHTVQSKVNWCSSGVYTADLRQDEIIYLKVSNGMKFYWVVFIFILAALLLRQFYYRISERTGWLAPVQLVLILPSLCYLLYYLTIGRNKYLELGPDKDNLFA